MHLCQYRSHLPNGKYDWKTTATTRTHDVARNDERHHQNVAVQKQERVQRLILSRGADLLNHSKIGQKRRNLGLPHVRRMPSPMKQHEPANPIDIRFLGPPAVTTRPQPTAHTFDEPEPTLRLRPSAELRNGNRRQTDIRHNAQSGHRAVPSHRFIAGDARKPHCRTSATRCISSRVDASTIQR
jgi:hypothetical protein